MPSLVEIMVLRKIFLFLFVWSFCPSWLFSTHMMISRRHHYQWRAANFDHYPELMAIQQWGFLACQPNVTWDICLQWLSPRICDTHTCCQALSSGAVTTCFNKLIKSVAARIQTSSYPVICNEAVVSCIVKWNVLINGWKPQTIYTSYLDIWNYTVLN